MNCDSWLPPKNSRTAAITGRVVLISRLRRDRLRIVDRHALADTALQALEAGANMHLDQLADRTDAPVAEVVDVVRLADAVVEPDHLANDLDQILLGQDALRDLAIGAVSSACSRLFSL